MLTVKDLMCFVLMFYFLTCIISLMIHIHVEFFIDYIKLLVLFCFQNKLFIALNKTHIRKFGNINYFIHFDVA